MNWSIQEHVSAVVLSSDSTLEDIVDVKQDKINDLDAICVIANIDGTSVYTNDGMLGLIDNVTPSDIILNNGVYELVLMN